MANTNDQVRRVFENAGKITITISATAYIVLNVVPGSFSWTPADPRRIAQSDRGVPSVDMEGDLLLSEFEFQYYATKQTSGGIYDRMMTAGTGGFAFQFDSVIAENPTYRGSSSGDRATFTSPWRSEAPKYQAAGVGAEGDIWSVKFKCATAPSFVSY